MAFEWDEANKAGIKFRKHGTRLPEPIPIWTTRMPALIPITKQDPTEQRFITIGMGAIGRLLVVV